VGALAGLGLEAAGLDAGRRFAGIRYSVGGVTATGRFPGEAFGLGIRRRDLDALLQQACRRHPRIEVKTGVRVRSVSGQPGRMEVCSDQGTWSCDAVVGADGLHSVVRRQQGLGLKTSGPPRYGARAHFEVGVDLDYVEVHVVEEGELYLTPVGDGRLNVAVLCDRSVAKRFGGDLRRGFLRLLRSSSRVEALIGDASPLTEPSLCGPLRQQVRSAVADGVVLVGDAAGFVDAITGEGMSLTLRSAEIAAEVLSSGLRAGQLQAAALAPYDRRRRRMARDQIWLTEIILWGLRRRRLARRVVAGLQANPRFFTQVLAVNTGSAPLSSLGLRGVFGVLRG